MYCMYRYIDAREQFYFTGTMRESVSEEVRAEVVLGQRGQDGQGQKFEPKQFLRLLSVGSNDGKNN
jgi:hypothetical protein